MSIVKDKREGEWGLRNCKQFSFQARVFACFQAREVSRKFRHSANLGVTDKEMTEQIDTLIAFLTCTPFLSGNHGVIASVQKMKKVIRKCENCVRIYLPLLYISG